MHTLLFQENYQAKWNIDHSYLKYKSPIVKSAIQLLDLLSAEQTDEQNKNII